MPTDNAVSTVASPKRRFNTVKNPLAEHLVKEWHPTKNGDMRAHDLSSGSNRKVWWLGSECAHEWEAKVCDRSQGRGCSYCSGKYILPGFNDLLTLKPLVASQFHPTKNAPLTVDQINVGSNKKVWWINADCGHEWLMKVATRNDHIPCSVCDGFTFLAGFNDLATTHPEISKYLHPTKNMDVDASMFTSYSNKKVWWLGDCGHEWQAIIANAAIRGLVCLYCCGRLVLPGFNDLGSQKPLLASEWHSTKNLPLKPSNVTLGSGKKVWWECLKGHEWQTPVYSRAKDNGHSCPTCVANCFISNAEQEIADFLMDQGLIIKQSDRLTLKGQEFDVYIPDKKVAIEYNGLYWHNDFKITDTEYHYKKWIASKDKGIRLIHVWEDEWKRNPEQIKNMLMHKLEMTIQTKIFARKTLITSVSQKEAEKFLDKNHIQGYSKASFYFGLKYNDQLISVLALKTAPKNILNIVRYATSQNIVGGFTKLLKYTEKTLNPSKIIAFADHCVSDGRLYATAGFIAVQKFSPDYQYVVKGERKHKDEYKIKKFRDDPNLKWEDGLTETELASLNGIPRIWDAGKTKWVKEVN
jgi:G:T-mismatch repair DNA endonuclease (very short patch repair protein)